MHPDLFEFEGNRRGSLPPAGKPIPPGKDDHMIRNAEFYRSWPADRLLPSTLSWLLAQRQATELGYQTRLAAGLTSPEKEQPPKWTWNPQ